MRALRSLLFVGALALSAGAAHAAQIGVSIGIGAPVVYAPAPPVVYAPAPVAYDEPPAPGPGYTWVAGYYSGRCWNPGRWVAAPGYGYGYRGHEWREHEWREHDRWEHARGYDRDHDRGEHRGWYR